MPTTAGAGSGRGVSEAAAALLRSKQQERMRVGVWRSRWDSVGAEFAI